MNESLGFQTGVRGTSVFCPGIIIHDPVIYYTELILYRQNIF